MDTNFYNLLGEILADDDICYHNNFHNNLYICLLFNKHLSKKELDYIYYNWKAFYMEPSKYIIYKDMVQESLKNIK